VIAARTIGHAVTDDDAIEERRLAQGEAGAPELVADVERQFVDARLETIAGEQRRIRAPLRIG
jgi:hypothetical protein